MSDHKKMPAVEVADIAQAEADGEKDEVIAWPKKR